MIGAVVVAGIDISGKWLVTAQSVVQTTCSLDVAQNGSTLAIDGECGIIGHVNLAGSIDPGSGSFMASGMAAAGSPCAAPGSLTMNGTAASDGNTFSGSFACGGDGGSFSGTRCGNGVIDPGEDCDNGPGSPISGPCCDATCHFALATVQCGSADPQCQLPPFCTGASAACPLPVNKPAGTPCDDGNSCTVGDACQGGSCVGTTKADGAPCDDLDTCTGPDTCTSGHCSGPPAPCTLGDDDNVICTPYLGCSTPAFVPPDASQAKCEVALLKAWAREADCVVKCHARQSDVAFRGKVQDDSPCEGKCAATASALAQQLVNENICPPCISHQEPFTAGSAEEADFQFVVHSINSKVACAGTASLADVDDRGIPAFVPPDAATLRCETAVDTNVSTLVSALTKCHVKAGDSALQGTPVDDDRCEDTAESRYDAATGKLGGCPACLDVAAVGAQTRMMSDGLVGFFYCSHSGG
jgi:hypothetical protein